MQKLALAIGWIAVVSGCDLEGSFDDHDVDCAELDGSFTTIDIRVTSTRGDFVDFGDAGLDLHLGTSVFSAEFFGAGRSSFGTSGTFLLDEGRFDEDDEIFFSPAAGDPLFLSRAAHRNVVFVCESFGRGFRLRSDDFRFDFEDDGRFERARFNAGFDSLGSP